jgi:8-oxo-dGTP pyrophosphatase MutT (NUDIX family)
MMAMCARPAIELAMSYALTETLRRQIAERCAAFQRLPTAATPGLKRAAVAVTLLEAADGAGSAGFLLTRRAEGLRGHGGQWALPGGRCEARETAVEAVLRELAEEVGLALPDQAVLGVLDDYPTRSGYLITPLVLWAGLGSRLEPDPSEVASVHRIGLGELTRTDAVDFISIPESDRRVIRFKINGSLLHAPTAAVLYQFRELLLGRTTRVVDLEQPVFAWR